jgi:hypothetical protein
MGAGSARSRGEGNSDPSKRGTPPVSEPLGGRPGPGEEPPGGKGSSGIRNLGGERGEPGFHLLGFLFVDTGFRSTQGE